MTGVFQPLPNPIPREIRINSSPGLLKNIKNRACSLLREEWRGGDSPPAGSHFSEVQMGGGAF